MYQIRIDAKITQYRWDENDNQYSINSDWSIELECENEEDLKTLFVLNDKSNFQYYLLPAFVQHHLKNSSEIDFDELNDHIFKMKTQIIKNLPIKR